MTFKSIHGIVKRAGQHVCHADTIFALQLEAASGEGADRPQMVLAVDAAECSPDVAAGLALVRDGDHVSLQYSESEDEGLIYRKYEGFQLNDGTLVSVTPARPR